MTPAYDITVTLSLADNSQATALTSPSAASGRKAGHHCHRRHTETGTDHSYHHHHLWDTPLIEKGVTG